MNLKQLYLDLKSTFTEENLNRITRKIINSFRNEEFDFFKNIVIHLDKFIKLDGLKLNKVFSKLVMLYHPDKLTFYQKEIENYYQNRDEEKLHQLSHIFITLQNINFISKYNTTDTLQDSGGPEDYGYEVDISDLDTIFDPNDFEGEQFAEDFTFDFLSAIKYREFGDINYNVQPYHLEELVGELNFSRHRIDDLTGIENCINITSLDLSNNEIVDITKLGFLSLLEELYLPKNEIYSVDGLSNLINLRILDLSFNNITDISPLYELPNLNYLNVIGNQIPEDQIIQMKKSRRIIVF